MRLIDADKIPYVDLSDGKKACIIAFAEKINQMPTIEPEPHWIKCSERLPEEDADILVTYVDGEEARIIPVNYGRGTWFDCIFNSALDSLKVIAWMPLPEPYREGES